MSIELDDLRLLKLFRDSFREGQSCAILGDCEQSHVAGLGIFKRQLNFVNVDTFDVNGDPTYKVDLTEPIDEALFGKYDWVIDCGTMQCCFDVCSVWKNILNLLSDRGCVVHMSSLVGFFGRGFYSLSPALFSEFYNANDFTIHSMATKIRRGKARRTWKTFHKDHTFLLNSDLGFQKKQRGFVPMIPNDAQICCFAKRNKRVEFTKPILQHYIDTNGR